MTFKGLLKCLTCKRTVIVLCLSLPLFLNSKSAFSQVKGGEKVEKKEHSPKKATIFSAVLPGLGQAYNQKYWKIPVIYAGLGISAYFIYFNNQQYQEFRNEFLFRQNVDENGTADFSGYSTAGVRDVMNVYMKRRDWAIATAAFIYFLNIIDANVDAHLFNFNVNPDLSFRWSPYIDRSLTASTGLSFSLKF